MSPAAAGEVRRTPRSRATRRRTQWLGALPLIACAGIAWGDANLESALQASLAGQPPELVQKLVEEKIVLLPGSDADPHEPGRVRALVLFSQPRRRVVELLIQTARQIEYRTDLEDLKTVERLPDHNVDEHDMKIMLMRISYWLRYQWDLQAGRISWSLDSRFPNQLRVAEGSWDLGELDADHTLARFATRIDVGPALPSFLQELATRKNLPTTLDRCRRWVDSDGRYRP